MQSRRRPLTALALLLGVSAIGCGGTTVTGPVASPPGAGTNTSGQTQPTTTVGSRSGTTGASGTTPAESKWTAEQQAVIDADASATKAIDNADSKPDGSDPALPLHLAQDMLRDMRIQIDQHKNAAVAVRFPTNSKSRVEYLEVSVKGNSASVTTCEVDDRVVYRLTDGSIVNDNTSTARWTVALVSDEAVWKVSGRRQTQTWDGEEMSACLGAQ